MVKVSNTSYEIIMLLVNGLTTVIYVFQICYDSSIATPNRNVSFIKSHHVMMTFLVFDLDVLFIPCYSSFFLSFFLLSFRRVNCVDCSSVSQKLSIESTSNFLCICRTRICSAL